METSAEATRVPSRVGRGDHRRHTIYQQPSTNKGLVRERVLTQDPARDLQLPRDERRLPRHPLSISEVEAVLAKADLTTPHGLGNRAILELLYSTGLRRDEALGLEFTDLDRERRTLLVRRGKGLKDRFVPIGERALT